MHTTDYEADGMLSAAMRINEADESVAVQIQARPEWYAMEWVTALNATRSIEEFTGLLGNLALTPETAFGVGKDIREGVESVTDLETAGEFVEAEAEDTNVVQLFTVDGVVLNWSARRLGTYVAIGGAGGSLDFDMLHKLLSATGSPEISANQTEIEAQARTVLSAYRSN